MLALGLARGDRKWEMEEPGFPLGLEGGRLYVLIQDRVLALDPATGKVLLSSDSLGLGPWAILGQYHSHGGQCG